MLRVTPALVGALLMFAAARADLQPTQKVPSTSAESALLEKYCVSCHSEARKAGGLALDRAAIDNIRTNPVVWEKVVLRMRTGLMPPPGVPRPDRATSD